MLIISIKCAVGCAVTCFAMMSSVGYAQQNKVETFKIPARVSDLLYENCYDCHDDSVRKGDIQLDQLGSLDLGVRLNVLNKMQEQLHFKNMPPKKAKPQPTDADRIEMLKWITGELKKHNASTLEGKLEMFPYANYVDHGKLFSGKYSHLKSYTYDRRWLVSEFIFNAKVNRLLNYSPVRTIDGKRHRVLGDTISGQFDITNPFLLPSNTGVRYYANTTLNGGHFLTMLTNAKNASVRMTEELGRRDRRYLPAYQKIMELEYKHEAILSSREKFVSNFIERLLVDAYGDAKHVVLLPKFKSIAPERPSKEVIENPNKPAINYGGPSREERKLIFITMRKQQKDAKSEDDLILRCEKEWFYAGHNARKIEARIKFFHLYMKEWHKYIKFYKYDDKNKKIVYKPLGESEMKLIKETLMKCRKKGDTYNVVIEKSMAHWRKEFKDEREKFGIPSDQLLSELVSQSFVKIHEREPTQDESEQYVSMTRNYVRQQGNLKGIQKLLQTLILRSDYVYRLEFGQGEADEHGRRMMSPFQASYAISYALTDSSPDKELVAAAKSGRLKTREDYKHEVQRLLKKRDQYYIVDTALRDSFTNLPIAKLRFFREFFGYPKLLSIFKDNKRFGGPHSHTQVRLVTEADLLVEHILKKDTNVIETLLNTEDFFVYHNGNNEVMTASTERIRKIYLYFKDKLWKDFTYDDLMKHKDFLDEVEMRGLRMDTKNKSHKKQSVELFKRGMTNFVLRYTSGQKYVAPYNTWPSHGKGNAQSRDGSYIGYPQVAHYFNLSLTEWDYPGKQPFKVKNRKGMLTHPAWLIAHAQNTETDPVIRGKWIREKLLAGTVPDIPVTVDAVVPEDHHNTLRTRLVKVTEKKYCWRCHEGMNPLGYAFEMYDDFGRFRIKESLEHPDNLVKKVKDKGGYHEDLRHIYKTLPVKTEGYLAGTGDKKLDGKVKNALDLADRLSRSERVRQSVVRHAFRYFMGRNERLFDSKTLIDADKAYVESGGSFDAIIVSLLTSDSFIYRKQSTQ